MVVNVYYAGIIDKIPGGYYADAKTGKIHHEGIKKGVSLGIVLDDVVELHYNVNDIEKVILALELRDALNIQRVPTRDVPPLDPLYRQLRAKGEDLSVVIAKVRCMASVDDEQQHNK